MDNDIQLKDEQQPLNDQSIPIPSIQSYYGGVVEENKSKYSPAILMTCIAFIVLCSGAIGLNFWEYYSQDSRLIVHGILPLVTCVALGILGIAGGATGKVNILIGHVVASTAFGGAVIAHQSNLEEESCLDCQAWGTDICESFLALSSRRTWAPLFIGIISVIPAALSYCYASQLQCLEALVTQQMQYSRAIVQKMLQNLQLDLKPNLSVRELNSKVNDLTYGKDSDKALAAKAIKALQAFDMIDESELQHAAALLEDAQQPYDEPDIEKAGKNLKAVAPEKELFHALSMEAQQEEQKDQERLQRQITAVFGVDSPDPQTDQVEPFTSLEHQQQQGWAYNKSDASAHNTEDNANYFHTTSLSASKKIKKVKKQKSSVDETIEETGELPSLKKKKSKKKQDSISDATDIEQTDTSKRKKKGKKSSGQELDQSIAGDFQQTQDLQDGVHEPEQSTIVSTPTLERKKTKKKKAKQ